MSFFENDFSKDELEALKNHLVKEFPTVGLASTDHAGLVLYQDDPSVLAMGQSRIRNITLQFNDNGHAYRNIRFPCYDLSLLKGLHESSVKYLHEPVSNLSNPNHGFQLDRDIRLN